MTRARILRSASIVALVAAMIVTGCSSEGNDNTVAGRLLPLVRSEILGGEQDLSVRDGAEPTRAELNQVPFATIALSYGELDPIYMIPLSDNGGYLTYQDPGQRGVVMFGGAVAGTEGLGNDLRAVRHGANDPIAFQRPLAEWPATIARSYQYRVRDLDEYVITVACSLEKVKFITYEILEIQYPLTRVEETCSNARRQFTNVYWVDNSGFVWASEQWMGPDLDVATIEIIRPYGG